VTSKPRDLGDDRGYRVVVATVSEGLDLNPHPLKSKRVRHPKAGFVFWSCGHVRSGATPAHVVRDPFELGRVGLQGFGGGFEEDDVGGAGAAGHGQGFAVAGPVDVVDLVGGEVGELFWWAAG